MTSPFYTSPEQLVRDRSEYARRNIARGRDVVVMTFADGILFVGENSSTALHKISEIYDRIAFAAVGKYNEFETLRVAGVRYADTRGYAYDRADVRGRGLANAFAQTLGSIFIESNKPFEVELVVAEVGREPADDQLFRLTYDGSVTEAHGHLAMGGQSEAITAALRESHDAAHDLTAAMRGALTALRAGATAGGNSDSAAASRAGLLEVAVLDRGKPRRSFRRITGPTLAALVEAAGGDADDTPPEGASDPS